MNYIDIVVFCFLIWFAYKGFSKGLVIELTSIISLVLGVYGGLKFSDITASKISEYVDSTYLPIISFTITFAIIVLLIYVIGKAIEKIINLAALKFTNKLAGALFSIAKIGLIISVLATIIESYDKKLNFIPSDVKENSLTYKPLLSIANIILPEIEKNNLFDNLKEDLNSN